MLFFFGFIDATNECIKVTNNNKLTQANIDRIVNTFAGREEVEHFSHLASYDEICGILGFDAQLCCLTLS